MDRDGLTDLTIHALTREMETLLATRSRESTHNTRLRSYHQYTPSSLLRYRTIVIVAVAAIAGLLLPRLVAVVVTAVHSIAIERTLAEPFPMLCC